jgi:Flp pilus assembly pilin Flp
MESPFRKLLMASAIASLLVALVSLEGTYELVTDSLLPLIKDGNGFTAYGWGVIVAIAARVAITGALVWAFARFGGAKPLPFSRRSEADTRPLERSLVTASPAR